MAPMAEHRVWTDEELLALRPAKRFRTLTDCIATDCIATDCIATDLDQVHPNVLEQARAEIREHIARTESTRTPER